MGRGAWWAMVHRVTELDTTEATLHACTYVPVRKSQNAMRLHQELTALVLECIHSTFIVSMRVWLH